MQFETKSFCPSAIVFAFAGTGFGRFAAAGGAFQSVLSANASGLAKANTSASKVLGEDLDNGTFINFAR
jgi:hypothetical protein